MMCSSSASTTLDLGFRDADDCRVTPAIQPETSTPDRVEWPTLVVVVMWAAGLAAVVVLHRSIPWWASVPGLAILGGLQFSLQHETIHGHPTPWRWLNTVLVGAPLAIWCPYALYRDSHLRHHASDLTVPGVDPESDHVTLATWRRAGPVGRALLWVNRTLAGRVVIGPWLAIGGVLTQGPRVWRSTRARRTVLVHVLLVAATVWSIVGVARLPWWEYAAGFVWGGTAVTLVRGFAEHRFVEGVGTRSAVVRSNRFVALLFLNNNLHHAHHALPGAPWYRLPGLHRELGADDLARAGAGWYRGYGEIARRYLVRPFGEPVHPSELPAPPMGMP